MANINPPQQAPTDRSSADPAKPPIDWHRALSEHDRWLRTIVYARLREPQAVEDVMQEVALAAIRQAAPLSDPSKVAPWLYRLAVRQALLYRRKCGRLRKLTDRYVEKYQPSETDSKHPDGLAWLLQAERQQRVRQAMKRLGKRDAEILLLKYSEDWSYHQIADHLGISHSAVEARLHRARKRLREQLVSMQVVEAS